MRYLKTFESFNINETMDMMFMPVDPIAGAADVYKEIGDYIKNKMTELVKFLGDKFDLFIEKLTSLADSIVGAIGDGAEKVLENIEKMFGPVGSLSYEDVKKMIELKFKGQIETAVKSNEGYYWEPSPEAKKNIHREQESGQGNATTSLPKDSGPVQAVLAILQNIFGLNLYACGLPIGYVLYLIFGNVAMGAFVFAIGSFVVTAIALAVIITARKLVYNLEHGK
jgi:hypothetical protein